MPVLRGLLAQFESLGAADEHLSRLAYSEYSNKLLEPSTSSLKQLVLPHVGIEVNKRKISITLVGLIAAARCS